MLNSFSIVASLMVGLLSFGTGYGQEVEWLNQRDIAGAFKIQVPGPFTHKTLEVETPLGRLAYETFFYQLEEPEDGVYFYQVSYCDYPPAAVHTDSLSSTMIDSFFQQTIAAAEESVQGSLKYADRSDYLQWPGYRWRIDYLEGEAIIRTWAFLKSNRYYALQAICHRQYALSPSVSQFMDSFALLDQREGEK